MTSERASQYTNGQRFPALCHCVMRFTYYVYALHGTTRLSPWVLRPSLSRLWPSSHVPEGGSRRQSRAVPRRLMQEPVGAVQAMGPLPARLCLPQPPGRTTLARPRTGFASARPRHGHGRLKALLSRLVSPAAKRGNTRERTETFGDSVGDSAPKWLEAWHARASLSGRPHKGRPVEVRERGSRRNHGSPRG